MPTARLPTVQATYWTSLNKSGGFVQWGPSWTSLNMSGPYTDTQHWKHYSTAACLAGGKYDDLPNEVSVPRSVNQPLRPIHTGHKRNISFACSVRSLICPAFTFTRWECAFIVCSHFSILSVIGLYDTTHTTPLIRITLILIYTGSRLQRVRLLRSPTHNEHVFTVKWPFLTDIKIKRFVWLPRLPLITNRFSWMKLLVVSETQCTFTVAFLDWNRSLIRKPVLLIQARDALPGTQKCTFLGT